MTKQLTTDISECMVDFDLNNDGQLDIIAIGYDSIDGKLNHLYYFENNSGTFLDPVSVGRASHEQDIELRKADINNDGFLDLVYIDKTSGNVNWYQNLTNGSLSVPIRVVSELPQIDGIEFADMDNDDLIDIVASSVTTDEIVWFKNLGMSGFGPAQLIVALSSGNFTIRITTTDYNSDGNEDLFYISQLSRQLMLINNLGNGVFDAPTEIDYYSSLNNYPFAPILNSMDINQDGTDDIVVNMLASNDNILWYEIVSGTISPRDQLSSSGIGALYEPLITNWADLNGDGFNEFILADWNDVVYFPNNSGTMSSTPVTLISNLPSYILDISVEDFNGDNYPDIVVNDATTGITSYANDSLFGFNLVQTLSPELLNPFYTTSADLDADGLTDFAFLKQNSRNLSWMKNLGSNDFDAPQPFFTVPSAPLFFGVYIRKFLITDLNNDGINDLLTLKASSSDGYLEYFAGTGNMTYGPSTALSATSLDVFDFKIADLDNDNDPDIVFCSYYDDQVGFYENLGSGSFSAAQIIDNTCDQAVTLAVADLDSDSDLDVISISVGDNKLRTFENTGNNTFAPPVIVSSQSFDGSSFQLVAEDADRDSIRDIILADPNTNKVSWFKNMGNGSFSAQYTITTAYNDPNIQLVDYDSDGDPDILCSSSYYALEERGTYLLENLGDGTFLSTGPKILTEAARGYTKWDFDADGDSDIVSCSENRLFYSENNHNGQTKAIGKIFYDLNNNGVLDTAEVGMTAIGIVTNPEVNYIFSDSQGNYRVNFYDTSQAHTISTQSLPNWGLTSSASYTLSVNSQFTEIDSLNFGFYPTAVVDSISTNLIGGFPRCNDTINYWLNIRNHGSSLPSGVVSLSLDTNLTYISANPLPDSVSNGNLHWNYENLFYFDDTLITIHVATPGFLQMGEEFVSSAEVTVLDNLDNIVYLVHDTLRQTLVCAYDPNDKTSEPSGVGYPGYVKELNDIEYLIRFQNTGNDTALVIVIKDQLDPLLDWPSIQPTGGSHEFTTSVDPAGLLTFTFANIHLPDSNTNELGSHGFVSFRIKANDNLPAGSVIRNHAEIYFDLNPPVVTNYKLLTLFDCETLFDDAPQSDAVFCAGDLVQFGTNYPETTYGWQSADSSSVESGPQVTIHAQNAGINTFTIHAENAFCSQDSVIGFITLPFIPLVSEGEVQVCPGDSVLIYDEYRRAAGLYYDTLQSQYGCDSIVVKELVVNPVPLISEGEVWVCPGDSVLIYGEYQNTTGLYYNTLQSQSGCDSIVVKELLVNPVSLISEGEVWVCQGDSVLIYGEYQNTVGLYYDTLQSQYGCDSIVVKELVVNPVPLVDFGYNFSDTLCLSNGVIVFDNSSPFGGTYSGNGMTGNTFDPNVAGEGTHTLYYHFVSPNLCGSADSMTLTIESCLGIKEFTSDAMTVYPNPTDGKVFIDFKQPFSGKIVIRDVSGKVYYVQTYSENQNIKIEITGQRGVYFLEARDADDIKRVFKLIKY